MKRIVALLALGVLAPMVQGAVGTFVPPQYCPDLGLLLVVGLGLCWRSTAGGVLLSATLVIGSGRGTAAERPDRAEVV